jgi:hypothetical protein
MLFVGLGGTGCRIGAELERRLRDELCGPDGTALRERMPGEQMLPYELPGCLQFVYADLAEDEFRHVENRAVPDRGHLPAAERTYTMVRELVPPYDTYPEVARRTSQGSARWPKAPDNCRRSAGPRSSRRSGLASRPPAPRC